MKTTVRFLIPILLTVAIASAKQKEFTVLGGQKIKAEVENGMPVPAEKNGLKVQAAAFMIGGGNLIFTFGFTTKNELKKVVVEDVTGATALPLVDDASPTLKKDYWMGNAAPLPLSKSGVPWVFERGDTTRIFRFTVTMDGQAEPVVLYQPAVYPAATKKQLQQMAR
jgi:hypothetical protein